MNLGLVSDTHDDLELARVAARFFADEGADLVLHLGDITEAETAACFDALPVRFLLGNNDEARPLARYAPARVFEEELAGVHVYAHHGHERAAPARREPDLLLHGHSHRARCERVGRTLVVNPGALHRARVKSVALVELPALQVRFFQVEPSGVAPLTLP